MYHKGTGKFGSSGVEGRDAELLIATQGRAALCGALRCHGRRWHVAFAECSFAGISSLVSVLNRVQAGLQINVLAMLWESLTCRHSMPLLKLSSPDASAPSATSFAAHLEQLHALWGGRVLVGRGECEHLPLPSVWCPIR